MSNKKRVMLPTLSTEGWIEDPIAVLDRNLAYIFTSSPTQSVLNQEKIVALFDLISKMQDNLPIALMDLKSKLEDYFYSLGYWESVEVECRDVTPSHVQNHSEIEIILNVFKDNQFYSVNRLLSSKDSKFTLMTRIHNEGNMR